MYYSLYNQVLSWLSNVPINILPIYNAMMLFFDLLIVTRTQPTKLGMQRTTIEYFLPSLLTKNPIIGPTRMAPAGKRGPIHPANSNVTPSMSH